MPSAGVNAVESAARYIGELLKIGDELKTRHPVSSRFDPPWTTINVGAISGGVAHNVIPQECTLDWEFRPINKADKSFVRERINSYAETVLVPQMQTVHPEASIEVEYVGDVDGLEPMENSAAVALAQALTGGNSVGLVPFGTEAGLFQELGISTVVCGPGYIAQAHKPDEYVEISQLAACLDMLQNLRVKLID
jgi:acetylornithine deacetylase